MTRKKSLLMLGDSLVEWGDWDTLLPELVTTAPFTRPCFLNDGVHLSTLGYQVWAGEIRKCCLVA